MVDSTVRRHHETEPKKTKSRTGRPKATTKTISSFNSLCDRRLTASNTTVQLNQCQEKMFQHPL